MVSELQELLRDTAPSPTRPLDTGALVRRARRQVLTSRVAAGLGGVVVFVAAVLFGPSVAGIEQGLEIADRPDSKHPDAEQREGLTADDLAAELWGRTYVSVEVTEDGTPRELLDGTRIELTLQREPLVRDVDGGQLVDPEADGFAIWEAGCNRNQSQLYVANGRFEFGGFGYTSLRLCASEEEDAQDRWVDEFFRSGPAWQFDGARLVLSAGEVTIVLEDSDVQAPALDRPDFQLGADHLWEGSGTFEEVAGTFLAEVLGWRMATLLEHGGPPTSMFLLFENAEGRPIELSLEAVSGSTDRWRVTHVSAGIEHPIRMTHKPSVLWRPIDDPRLRHGAFEGVVGTAYIGTPERGTIAVPIDEQAVAAAEVTLAGIVEGGHPFCQIQAVLLLFEDSQGVVTSAVGVGTDRTETPPDCPVT